MNKLGNLIGALICAIAAGIAPVHADEVAEFYAGRTLSLFIGYSAGGGYDAYGRALARHLGKHIAGNPSVVPRNRPGAGSLVLANEIGTTLPRDGSAIGLIGRAQALEPLFGNPAAVFDPRAFNWIGSANNEVSICIAWHATPVRSFADLLSRGMIVGGTGPGGDSDSFPRVLNSILGTRLKLITGYPGGNELMLAMERGEIEGRCGYSYSSLVSRRGDWLATRKVRILAQMSTARHPAMPDVPFIMDLAKDDREREILGIVFAAQAMGRPFVAPPGVPKARVAALRAGFDATMSDPEFRTDVEQQRLALAPVSGAQVQALVAHLYAQPPELVKAAREAAR